MTSMTEANAAHEAYMARHLTTVAADLTLKRQEMGRDAFRFLRATCFRFAARFAGLAPQHATALPVPSVGDAHLENFGTWRDAEGRLVWGVNDLDEAALLPWPADLLRLATSALLAPGQADIAADLLEGYAARLAAPQAFILDEEHRRLREVAVPDADERIAFWQGIDGLPTDVPLPAMRAALTAALPAGASRIRFARRQAGLGSLGRSRFVAVAFWRGGRVVREAKARLPSAWVEAGFPGAAALDVAKLANCAARAPDPWSVLTPELVLRRLAPDSRKLEIPPGEHPAFIKLARAMGGELANIHASAGDGPGLLAALSQQPAGWLARGAARLARATLEDLAAWRR